MGTERWRSSTTTASGWSARRGLRPATGSTKTLGFSLDEIRELIASAERGSCSEVVPAVERLLAQKIAAIDAQVAELGAFRKRLVAFRADRGSGCGCDGHEVFCGCLNEVAPSDDAASVA